jgi:hypothetical protein
MTRDTYRQSSRSLQKHCLAACVSRSALHEHIQHVAVLIHRPPEIVTFAVNGEKDLIPMPRVARLRASASELMGIGLVERAAPLADGFIGHCDPTRKEQLFDIAIPEAKPK